jgi:hypothetical protein
MVDKMGIVVKCGQYFQTSRPMQVDDSGKISTEGNVGAKGKKMGDELPVQFDRVGGLFNCRDSGLLSLAGSPNYVGDYFNCSGNRLHSLQGAPQVVVGDFVCKINFLTSLEGMPESVGADVDASFNRELESLKGLPNYFPGKLYLTYTLKLPLLRALCARDGVKFTGTQAKLSHTAEQIQNILNQFAGQGRRGVLKCSHALLTLEKELGKDIRANIKW